MRTHALTRTNWKVRAQPNVNCKIFVFFFTFSNHQNEKKIEIRSIWAANTCMRTATRSFYLFIYFHCKSKHGTLWRHNERIHAYENTTTTPQSESMTNARQSNRFNRNALNKHWTNDSNALGQILTNCLCAAHSSTKSKSFSVLCMCIFLLADLMLSFFSQFFSFLFFVLFSVDFSLESFLNCPYCSVSSRSAHSAIFVLFFSNRNFRMDCESSKIYRRARTRHTYYCSAIGQGKKKKNEILGNASTYTNQRKMERKTTTTTTKATATTMMMIVSTNRIHSVYLYDDNVDAACTQTHRHTHTHGNGGGGGFR